MEQSSVPYVELKATKPDGIPIWHQALPNPAKCDVQNVDACKYVVMSSILLGFS